MLHVLFCGNEGVFDGVLSCTLSILHRSQIPEGLHVHLFTMDATHLDVRYTPITSQQIAFLSRVLHSYGENHCVSCTDVTALYREEFSGCPNENAYCSPFTLIRLLADRVEGLPDKLLYLDADVLFNRDVHLLYDIDVSDVEYAAARDHYGKYLIHPNYINAGVLLFNLAHMRECGTFVRAREWLRRKKLPFADQSALIRATQKRRMLPQKFNDQKFLHTHTVVRHFSKRLFYLPYPHTENIKQWQVERVRHVFGYPQLNDILNEYQRLMEEYRREYQ